MRRGVVGAVLLIWAACPFGDAVAADKGADFTPDEVRRVLRHGPWPPRWLPDPSNRVSGQAAAATLGRLLFFDPRLSANGQVSCASCHRSELGWSDGARVGVGLQAVDRNTLGLLDARHQRWFGWDGANDTLWAQSIRPILDEREMGGSAAEVAALVRNDRELHCRYRDAFGAEPGKRADEDVLVDAGKALAAFQETLVSGPSPFDRFRDALAASNETGQADYPLAARRGLKIFVGKGDCHVCHFGSAFTNGEFHDIGIPFFAVPGRVDPGRHGGIGKLLASPYNLLGAHNDDPARRSALGTRHVTVVQRNFGEFKVPSLRNVALTAPYMHNGSLATLADVVRHYSEFDENRIHADGERLLRPLRLAPGEIDDLVAFLESLTGSPVPPAPPPIACLTIR